MKRLADFSVVVVDPPWRGMLRSDSFECHVVAVIGNTAAIEPVDPASTLWLPERLEHSLLSFRHDGSLVGLYGTLLLREGVSDLRFTVTDGVKSASRRATRIDMCAPIALRRADASAAVEGLTVNLSAYEIVVDCDLDVGLGDAVEFSLALPGVDESFEAAAKVIRVQEGRVELEVDVRNRPLRSRLARFVVAHNRTVLRRRPRVTNDALELDF